MNEGIRTYIPYRIEQKGGEGVGRMRRFFLSAALMAGVNILLRFASVSFNAYVSRKIGAEAMGLFTLVMSVYGLSVTLATSGVNLAAVRLSAAAIAEDGGTTKLHGVLRGCMVYSLLFGITAGMGLFTLSDFIGVRLLGDGRTIPSLRVLAMSLPAISLSSALAGYFTGIRQVYKNAIISVTEQFIKITLTAALLLLFAPGGIEYACLAVVGGAALAEGMSLITSICLYLLGRRRERGRAFAFGDVFRCAFPTAVGSYARQGLVTAEHLAIPWGLRKSGADPSAALASYGVLHGMVYPLIFFPSAVLGAFNSLLIPEFAEAAERGETERIGRMAERVFETTLWFAIGVAGLFLSFSFEIGEGIYPGTGAAAHLKLLAPLIPVMYLDSATDAMLKGLGEQLHTMKINILDASLCFALVLILIPRFGLTGYFIVQYTCELLNAALSITRLMEKTSLRPHVLRWVGLPLCGTILSASLVRLLSGIPGFPLIGLGSDAPWRVAAAVAGYGVFLAIALRWKKHTQKGCRLK